MRRKERGYDNKWLAGKGEGEGGLAAEQSSDPRTFFADYKARIFVYNVSLFIRRSITTVGQRSTTCGRKTPLL